MLKTVTAYSTRENDGKIRSVIFSGSPMFREINSAAFYGKYNEPNVTIHVIADFLMPEYQVNKLRGIIRRGEGTKFEFPVHVYTPTPKKQKIEVKKLPKQQGKTLFG